jgi:hypothetical protein
MSKLSISNATTIHRHLSRSSCSDLMGGGPRTPPSHLMDSLEETFEDDHLLEHSIDGRSVSWLEAATPVLQLPIKCFAYIPPAMVHRYSRMIWSKSLAQRPYHQEITPQDRIHTHKSPLLIPLKYQSQAQMNPRKKSQSLTSYAGRKAKFIS